MYQSTLTVADIVYFYKRMTKFTELYIKSINSTWYISQCWDFQTILGRQWEQALYGDKERRHLTAKSAVWLAKVVSLEKCWSLFKQWASGGHHSLTHWSISQQHTELMQGKIGKIAK